MDKLKILFFCAGNSARSILAEYILRKRDPIRFASFSAGADPKDKPHPMALKVLNEQFHVKTTDARSKSWDEFKDVSIQISRRIDLLTALPFEKLWKNYRLKFEEEVKRIGEKENSMPNEGSAAAF